MRRDAEAAGCAVGRCHLAEFVQRAGNAALVTQVNSVERRKGCCGAQQFETAKKVTTGRAKASAGRVRS